METSWKIPTTLMSQCVSSCPLGGSAAPYRRFPRLSASRGGGVGPSGAGGSGPLPAVHLGPPGLPTCPPGGPTHIWSESGPAGALGTPAAPWELQPPQGQPSDWQPPARDRGRPCWRECEFLGGWPQQGTFLPGREGWVGGCHPFQTKPHLPAGTGPRAPSPMGPCPPLRPLREQSPPATATATRALCHPHRAQAQFSAGG